MSRRSVRRRAGVSLVEAVLSTLVVSIMLVSVLQALGAAAKADQVHANQRVGPALASQLMAEILACPYEDDKHTVFGPENGEVHSSRFKYDDVDDYNGWSSSTIQDKDGNAISGLTGWSRSSVVQWVQPSNVATVAAAESGLKRIIVTVTDPDGRTSTITGLRASGGAYDYEPDGNTTYVNWVGVSLQVGSDDTVRMFSGVNLLNCVPNSEDD